MELLNGAYLHGNPNAFLYVRSPELFKSKETFVGMDQMERKQAELELALQLTEMFEVRNIDMPISYWFMKVMKLQFFWLIIIFSVNY